MKDIIFKGKIQFGIWKFLESVEGVVKPQYGCAQPIENGVHLGNGNDTIEDVGICEINPPSISCDGAITGATWSGGFEDMLFNKTIEATSNGVTKTFDTGPNPWVNLPVAINDYFTGMFGVIFAVLDGWGFDTFGEATDNVRVKITPNDPLDTSLSSWQQIDHLDAFDNNQGMNPTVVKSQNSINFCMKEYSSSISCDGATNQILMHSDLSTRDLQISVNGSSYVAIFDQEYVEIIYYPTSYGATLTINKKGVDAQRCTLKSDSDIFLLGFNTLNQDDEVNQPNQSYSLYNADGELIDPNNMSNRVPLENDAYAIYFRSIEFCLDNAEETN